MKLKRFALRGLVILAVSVALCMFFARTVQTITTPKVRLLSPERGRLERKISLTAEVFYDGTEEFKIEDAKENPVTVGRILVRAGQKVSEGDVIFTSSVGSFTEDLDKLREDYNGKAAELAELDISNRKNSKASRQNELYDDMMAAMKQAAETKIDARVKAGAAGIKLTNDVATWRKQLGTVRNVPEDVSTAISKAIAASKAYDTASAAFLAVYEDRKMRVSDDVFNYIKERKKLLDELNQLLDDMVAMNDRVSGLTEIRAARDGWLVSVGVQEGDEYNGSGVAYTLSAEGTGPALRAELSESDRSSIAEGTKVTIQLDNDNKVTSVVTKLTSTANARYAIIDIPEDMLQSTTAMRSALDDGVSVTINWRAKQSTTLLPAAAVRADGDTSYVYLIDQQYGGFLRSSGMKVVKTEVTIEGRNDRQVAISEDFSWQQIAYQEDRALSDGMAVMEYVK